MEIGFITRDFERKFPEFGTKWGQNVTSLVSNFVKKCRNQFATKEWVYATLRETIDCDGKGTFEKIFYDVWQIFGQERNVMFVADKYMMLRAYNRDYPRMDQFIKQFKVLVDDFEFSTKTVPELVKRVLSTMAEPIEEEYAVYVVSKMLVKSESHSYGVSKFNVSLYRLAAMFKQKVVFILGEDRVVNLSRMKDMLGYCKIYASPMIEECKQPQEVYDVVVRAIREKLAMGMKVAIELPSINPVILCNIFNKYYDKECRFKHNDERTKSISKSMGVVIYAGSPSTDNFKKMFNAMDENDVFIPLEIAKTKT